MKAFLIHLGRRSLLDLNIVQPFLYQLLAAERLEIIFSENNSSAKDLITRAFEQARRERIESNFNFIFVSSEQILPDQTTVFRKSLVMQLRQLHELVNELAAKYKVQPKRNLFFSFDRTGYEDFHTAEGEMAEVFHFDSQGYFNTNGLFPWFNETLINDFSSAWKIDIARDSIIVNDRQPLAEECILEIRKFIHHADGRFQHVQCGEGMAFIEPLRINTTKKYISFLNEILLDKMKLERFTPDGFLKTVLRSECSVYSDWVGNFAQLFFLGLDVNKPDANYANSFKFAILLNYLLQGRELEAEFARIKLPVSIELDEPDHVSLQLLLNSWISEIDSVSRTIDGLTIREITYNRYSQPELPSPVDPYKIPPLIDIENSIHDFASTVYNAESPQKFDRYIREALKDIEKHYILMTKELRQWFSTKPLSEEAMVSTPCTINVINLESEMTELENEAMKTSSEDVYDYYEEFKKAHLGPIEAATGKVKAILANLPRLKDQLMILGFIAVLTIIFYGQFVYYEHLRIPGLAVILFLEVTILVGIKFYLFRKFKRPFLDIILNYNAYIENARRLIAAYEEKREIDNRQLALRYSISSLRETMASYQLHSRKLQYYRELLAQLKQNSRGLAANMDIAVNYKHMAEEPNGLVIDAPPFKNKILIPALEAKSLPVKIEGKGLDITTPLKIFEEMNITVIK